MSHFQNGSTICMAIFRPPPGLHLSLSIQLTSSGKSMESACQLFIKQSSRTSESTDMKTNTWTDSSLIQDEREKSEHIPKQRQAHISVVRLINTGNNIRSKLISSNKFFTPPPSPQPLYHIPNPSTPTFTMHFSSLSLAAATLLITQAAATCYSGGGTWGNDAQKNDARNKINDWCRTYGNANYGSGVQAKSCVDYSNGKIMLRIKNGAGSTKFLDYSGCTSTLYPFLVDCNYGGYNDGGSGWRGRYVAWLSCVFLTGLC